LGPEHFKSASGLSLAYYQQIFIMSLYRKYRPQNFANLVGQEHVRTTIINALTSGNVNHAYLFTGPRGTGKTSTARLLAKAINCENLQKTRQGDAGDSANKGLSNWVEPCETCDICKDITDGRLIDLIEIDAASNRGIDEIRDLREKIQFSPTRARSKVYIIDEVHMLTKEAFNALLKTLEEPPSHVYFILATTEVHKIPETILSRCQRFDFKRIDDKTLQDRLAFIAKEEKIEAEEAALEIIVRSAQGGLRDAIGLLEQLNQNGVLAFKHVQQALGISGKMSLDNLYESLNKKNVQAGLAEIHALYTEGYDLNQFNKDFLELLRKEMLISVEAGKIQDTAWILKMIGYFQQSYEQMRFSTIPQLPLEVAIIQSCLELEAVQAKSINLSKPVAVSAPPAEKSATVVKAQAVAAKVEPAVIAIERKHQPIEPIAKPIQTPVQAHAQVPSAQAQVQAPEKVATTQAPVSPVATAEISTPAKTVSLSLDEIKKQWNRVVDKLKSSIGKKTITTGRIKSFEGNELRMSFQSQFHLSKIKENTVSMDIEEALLAVFQTHLKFVPVLEDMPKLSQAESEEASKLLEVFGGELVQD
jgi:DNA polymerase-3 subunit gamma/tau